MLPAPSTATPNGPFSAAVEAGPSSPEKSFVPTPATVVMIPPEDILRIRFSQQSSGPKPSRTVQPGSEKKTFPAPSTATALASFSWASIAGPPSPELPDQIGLPATVVIMPLGETLR